MQAEPQRSPSSPDDNPPPGGREPLFNIATVVLVLIAVNFAVHGIRAYVLDPDNNIALLIRTAFVPIRYGPLGGGMDVWWFTTPFTYSFLHGGMAHLGFNMIWLAIFGSPLAARLGASRFMGLYFGAVLAAAATHYAVDPGSAALLIGASGGVSGVTGAAARYAFRVSRNAGVRRFDGPLLPVSVALRIPLVLAFCGFWLAINALTGAGLLSPDGSTNIAWQAHVGGFAFGFLLAGVFDRR